MESDKVVLHKICTVANDKEGKRSDVMLLAKVLLANIPVCYIQRNRNSPQMKS